MSYTTAPQFTVDDAGFIQLAVTKVLAAVARGELDLNALAREELAGRGLDHNGTWVGPVEARRIFDASNPAAPAKPAREEVPGPLSRGVASCWLFAVEGQGDFPEDMLRYDDAKFASVTDAAKSIRAPDSRIADSRRTVGLVSTKRGGPTDARWQSFGWKVVECCKARAGR